MDSFYQCHCENLKMIEKAVKSVQLTLRDFISTDDGKNADTYTMILSHLINTWAEVRVLKLLYEEHAFNDCDKNEIIKKKELNGKWKKSLEIAFRKACGISDGKKINEVNTPFTNRSRYLALLDLIDTELLESNQLRNRIAHGQWKFAFNSDLSEVNGDLTGRLRTENIVKLQLRLKMFKSLAQIIHDLAVSKPTFERDFDKNFRQIEEQKRNFHNRDYESYKNKMVLKKERGKEKREKNQTLVSKS